MVVIVLLVLLLNVTGVSIFHNGWSNDLKNLKIRYCTWSFEFRVALQILHTNYLSRNKLITVPYRKGCP